MGAKHRQCPGGSGEVSVNGKPDRSRQYVGITFSVLMDAGNTDAGNVAGIMLSGKASALNPSRIHQSHVMMYPGSLVSAV